MSENFFAMEKTLQIGQIDRIISNNHPKFVVGDKLSYDTSKDLNTIDTGEIYTEIYPILHKKSEPASAFSRSKIIE